MTQKRKLRPGDPLLVTPEYKHWYETEVGQTMGSVKLGEICYVEKINDDRIQARVLVQDGPSYFYQGYRIYKSTVLPSIPMRVAQSMHQAFMERLTQE